MNILITGASGGIGFLTGLVLGSRNHNVYMCTKTYEEEKKLKEKVKYLNLDINVLKLDVTNKDDRELINNLDLDCIFLHAGVGYTGLLKDIDIDLVRDNFEVNVFSNMELIKIFLNKNEELPKKVVVTSSLFSNHACPYFGSYILSKSCIDLMMKIYKNENILSNNKFILIKPGAYHTGFNQYLALTGEKNGVNKELVSLFEKLFYLSESKDITSIVVDIVYAIEKSTCFKYSKPFIQTLLLDK